MARYGFGCLIGCFLGVLCAAVAGGCWLIFGGETFVDHFIDF
jgi:hypothetical protein